MEGDSLLIEAGLRWYALRTKSNKEKEVEKRLTDLKVEVFLPWLRARRRVGTRFQWVLVPLFPCYLFCRLDLVHSGKIVRYSPGVRDFLKFGNVIAEIGDSVIGELRDRCPDGVARIEPVAIKPGETVKIKEGPFAGLEAIFEQKMKGNERVAVLLEFLGRQTRVVVPGETIGRI